MTCLLAEANAELKTNYDLSFASQIYSSLLSMELEYAFSRQAAQSCGRIPCPPL